LPGKGAAVLARVSLRRWSVAQGGTAEQMTQGQLGDDGDGPLAGEQAEQRTLEEVDAHRGPP